MKRKIYKSGLMLTFVFVLLISVSGAVGAQEGRIGQTKDGLLSLQSLLLSSSLTVDDTLTADQLAGLLVGAGPTAPNIFNVTFTGNSMGAGSFNGGAGIMGLESGIVLGSGRVIDVVGPNVNDATTWDFGLPGDYDLDTLIPGYHTNDATVLEFDFECPTGTGGESVVSFSYVFTSEEYNEWVNSAYNDVFGFFLNGTNIALLPDGVTPVSINNVNNGHSVGGGLPGTNPSNPAFYINNDISDGGPFIDIEADGLTVMLGAQASINPGVANHLRLAIADAGDHVLDSWVFIEEGSFVCAPLNQPPVADPNGPYYGDEGSPVTFDGTGSYDPDGDPLTYDWDFGDGTVALDAGPTPSHVYDDNGVYDICLTVTDPGGLSDTQCASTTPMDVVFALDSSGSMAWNDPAGLRRTASKDFVDKMNAAQDLAGVVSWDHSIDFTYPLSSDFADVKAHIDMVNSSGGTDLDVGLSAAIGLLDSGKQAGSSWVIIMLSNGEGAYGGGPTAEAASKGYVIYSIGLGPAPATGPLTDMANATGGQYYPAPSPENLQSIFEDIFVAVSGKAYIANVAPTATFNAPTYAIAGQNFGLSLTDPHDPSTADTAAGFEYSFDCGDGGGYGAWSGSNSATCSPPPDGIHHWTVMGRIRDKDGGVTEYSATVVILPPSSTTNSSLCYYDRQLEIPGQQFRLIFTPDMQAWPAYKLPASNPGQFFYNVFYAGHGPASFDISIPHPFETQGANPVHVYTDVSVVERDGFQCFEPDLGSEVYSGDLEGLSGLSAPGGFLYVTVHLDYGLKGTTGYIPNANNDALSAADGTTVLIPNLHDYTFSVSGSQTDSRTIQNANDFKKIPGFGGLVTDGVNPVEGAVVEIRVNGALLGTATTDPDGWYMFIYKHTGKRAVFTVKLGVVEKSGEMKPNKFVEVNFP